MRCGRWTQNSAWGGSEVSRAVQTLTQPTEASSLVSCPLSPSLSPACWNPSKLPKQGRRTPPLSALYWGQVFWVLFLSLPPLAKSPLAPARPSRPEARGAVDLEQQGWAAEWGRCKDRAGVHETILTVSPAGGM